MYSMLLTINDGSYTNGSAQSHRNGMRSGRAPGGEGGFAARIVRLPYYILLKDAMRRPGRKCGD